MIIVVAVVKKNDHPHHRHDHHLQNSYFIYVHFSKWLSDLLVLSRDWMGMGEWDYHWWLWIIPIRSLPVAPVSHPCWLMISWGILLPNLLGIVILQERGIPNKSNQYWMIEIDRRIAGPCGNPPLILRKKKMGDFPYQKPYSKGGLPRPMTMATHPDRAPRPPVRTWHRYARVPVRAPGHRPDLVVVGRAIWTC